MRVTLPTVSKWIFFLTLSFLAIFLSPPRVLAADFSNTKISVDPQTVNPDSNIKVHVTGLPGKDLGKKGQMIIFRLSNVDGTYTVPTEMSMYMNSELAKTGVGNNIWCAPSTIIINSNSGNFWPIFNDVWSYQKNANGDSGSEFCDTKGDDTIELHFIINTTNLDCNPNGANKSCKIDIYLADPVLKSGKGYADDPYPTAYDSGSAVKQAYHSPPAIFQFNNQDIKNFKDVKLFVDPTSQTSGKDTLFMSGTQDNYDKANVSIFSLPVQSSSYKLIIGKVESGNEIPLQQITFNPLDDGSTDVKQFCVGSYDPTWRNATCSPFHDNQKNKDTINFQSGFDPSKLVDLIGKQTSYSLYVRLFLTSGSSTNDTLSEIGNPVFFTLLPLDSNGGGLIKYLVNGTEAPSAQFSKNDEVTVEGIGCTGNDTTRFQWWQGKTANDLETCTSSAGCGTSEEKKADSGHTSIATTFAIDPNNNPTKYLIVLWCDNSSGSTLKASSIFSVFDGDSTSCYICTEGEDFRGTLTNPACCKGGICQAPTSQESCPLNRCTQGAKCDYVPPPPPPPPCKTAIFYNTDGTPESVAVNLDVTLFSGEEDIRDQYSGRAFTCVATYSALGTLATDPGGFVRSVLGFLLSISGGIALLLIIRSGYQMMTSSGNPEIIQEARDRITSAIVGLLFIILSLIILQVIGVDIFQLPGFGS